MHRRAIVLSFGVMWLRWGGGCLQLLVDLAGPFPCGGKFGGLRKGLAEAGGGVVDLATGTVDVGEDASLAGFEAAEPVFEPGNQASRVDLGEVRGREGHLGAGRVFECRGYGDLARGLGDGDGQGEAAEFPGAHGSLPESQLVRGFLPDPVEQVPAGVGALAVGAAVNGHGERIAAGVLPPGDGGVDVVGEPGLCGDVLLQAGDGAAQAVLGASGHFAVRVVAIQVSGVGGALCWRVLATGGGVAVP